MKLYDLYSSFLPMEYIRNMYRNIIRQNVPMASIILFIIVFGAIQMAKPAFLYNPDGSIREFGVGYKNKTILPIWLLSLVLGILSYTAIMYYVVHPRLF